MTGVLFRRSGELFVQVDDGGAWRLEAWPWSKRLLGRRVTIVGVWSGFDLLDVESIRHEDGRPQPFRWWHRHIGFGR